jgi:hypothetical protein
MVAVQPAASGTQPVDRHSLDSVGVSSVGQWRVLRCVLIDA